jgi:hypothetical protein
MIAHRTLSSAKPTKPTATTIPQGENMGKRKPARPNGGGIQDGMARARLFRYAPDLYTLARDIADGRVSPATIRARASGIVFEIDTGQRSTSTTTRDREE